MRAGWLGKGGGSTFVALDLALAVAVTAGILLAGGGSTVAAWTAYILTAPFMVFILPYFAGVALVRHGGRASVALDRDGGVATDVLLRS
jgi:hypothetical protein